MGEKRKRYALPDMVRGLTLISMICYHGVWDLVFVFGERIPWYVSEIGYAWQQSICWSFLLLSGFCWSMGEHRVHRGLMVSAAGALVTLVTVLVMPQNRAVFGVLTLIGSCTLLWIWPEKLLGRIHPLWGLSGSLLLFTLFRNVNEGFLGFEGWNLVRLPQGWYQNLFTAWLGFPAPDFYSTDYFSLLPWCFLFLVGYYLYRLMERRKHLRWLDAGRLPALEWLGRQSLILYLAHQPVLFAALSLFYD